MHFGISLMLLRSSLIGSTIGKILLDLANLLSLMLIVYTFIHFLDSTILLHRFVTVLPQFDTTQFNKNERILKFANARGASPQRQVMSSACCRSVIT